MLLDANAGVRWQQPCVASEIQDVGHGYENMRLSHGILTFRSATDVPLTCIQMLSFRLPIELMMDLPSPMVPDRVPFTRQRASSLSPWYVTLKWQLTVGSANFERDGIRKFEPLRSFSVTT